MATATDPEANGTAEVQAKPPFLRRVRIRGYKSIAFCDVTLEPLTILVGRNASGKSNFLDAIAFLRDVVRLGVIEAVKRRGGPEAILCRFATDRTISFEVECGYESGDTESPVDAVFALKLLLPAKQRPRIHAESLELSTGNERMGYNHEGHQVTCFASGDQPVEWVWGEWDHPFLLSYNSELRTSRVSLFSDGLATLFNYNFLPNHIRQLHHPGPGIELESDGANLASVIETTNDNEKHTIPRIGRYFETIADSVEFLGVVKYGEYETVRFRVRKSDSEAPVEFDAASMSDGTLRALAALVAAFQFVPPFGCPGLVAIEEPETSLHPTAMRALVDALDEATLRTQILLTTHSAEMLDNPTIKPENIRVVQMIDGQTVIAPVDEASIEIVRQKLDTLGGLERQNQLEPNLDDLDRQRLLSQNGQEPKP